MINAEQFIRIFEARGIGVDIKCEEPQLYVVHINPTVSGTGIAGYGDSLLSAMDDALSQDAKKVKEWVNK